MIFCYSTEHGTKQAEATQVYLSPQGTVRGLCDEHAEQADKKGGWRFINNATIDGDNIVITELNISDDLPPKSNKKNYNGSEQ